MTRSYWMLLLLLSAVWGASYLFIKEAVQEIAPATTMAIRLLVATVILHGFLFAARGVRRSVKELAAAWQPGLVLGVVNGAVPFTLIGWGERHVDSGVAAIANASVPIFNVLFAWNLLPRERVTGARLGGVLLGLVGVAILTGFHPRGDSLAVEGTLAVVLASASYALAGIYGQGRVASIPGPVLAASSTFFGFIVLVPVAAFQLPASMPGWKATVSVLALAVLGTAVAQLILFRMLLLHGSARLSLVTYLLPATALVYGALLLHEHLSVSMLAGLALILGGVAFGSGSLRWFRRPPVAQSP
ncbi:MAG: DMT family transporter [Gaiellaceae bacterium]